MDPLFEPCCRWKANFIYSLSQIVDGCIGLLTLGHIKGNLSFRTAFYLAKRRRRIDNG